MYEASSGRELSCETGGSGGKPSRLKGESAYYKKRKQARTNNNSHQEEEDRKVGRVGVPPSGREQSLVIASPL